MTLTNLVRYRCDRCSTDFLQADDEPPPRFWVALEVTELEDTAVKWSADLCGSCRDSLNHWRYDA